MPLIKEGSIKVFDTEAVHKGDLVRAQYHTWPEPRNGLLASVSEERLTVLFLPGLSNVSNYFPIAAAEVAAGLWKVRWSSDLETIDAEGEEINLRRAKKRKRRTQTAEKGGTDG